MSGITDERTTALRLKVTARSTFFAEDDARTDAEAFELQQAIQRALPGQVASRPAPGEKGVITEVILPLASSGAFSAAAEVFKAWMARRPANRTIDVEYQIDDGGAGRRAGSFRLDATNVDDSVLNTIAKEVPWHGR